MSATGPQVPIRELRRAYGITLIRLADRIGQQGFPVHPDTLSNVELGRRHASRDLIAAWARALNVSPLDVQQSTQLDEDTA